MSKIIIEEQDLTTTGLTELQGTDIVYVPGFSSLISGDSVVPAYVPTLCSSVREFEKYFGDTPALFKEDQPYTEPTTQTSPSYVFNSYAKAGLTKMFSMGDVDPSYIYAKELLTAGIPVLYERINTVADSTKDNYDVTLHHMYEVLNSKFVKQASVVSTESSFIGEEGQYVVIEPENCDMTVFSKLYPVAGKYSFWFKKYKPSSTATAYNYKWFNKEGYVLTESQPLDWEISYTEYFTRVEINKKKNEEVKVYEYIKVTEAEVTPTWSANTYYDLGKVVDMTGSGIPITMSQPLTAEDIIDVCLSVTYEYADAALLNKGDYQFKYLTTGAYPSFECNGKNLAQNMATLAASRGDCIALIDHTNNSGRALVNYSSVYVNAKSEDLKLTNQTQSFASMFTPWASYSLSASYGEQDITSCMLPASFAYLRSLANSITSNPNWYAIAGATRGKIPSVRYLNTDITLTNAIADIYQPEDELAINPITNIKPYGLCIWGNRTLVDNAVKGGTTAISYLNIRNLVSDIKKQLYVACKKLMFEQNSDILWANFLAMITPLLDQMVSGSGISGYKVVRVATTQKATVKAIVRIYPIYAVEAFELTVILQDSESSVEE